MNRIPPHLDEADLLAIAEGKAYLASNPKAVRAAIEADPGLGRLLRDLRADRDELHVLASDIVAPANLLEGIESRLERDVIARLAHAETGDLPLPVSSVVMTSPSVWRRFAESRQTRRFAVAAAIAVAGLTVGLLVRNAIVSGTSPKLNDSRNMANLPDSTRDDAANDPNRTDLANNNTTTPGDAPAPGATDDRALAHSNPADSTHTPAEHPLPSPVVPTITLAQAVELAAQNRLVIRVRSERSTAADDMQAIASRTPKDIRWKPLEGASQVVAVLAAKFAPPPRVLPVKPAPGDTAITSDKPNVGNPSNTPPLQPNVSQPAALASDTIKPLYVLEFESTESRLESIVAALARASSNVELVALDEPLGVTAGLDPAAMLWWGRKPQDWVKRVAVPVVLDTTKDAASTTKDGAK